jgi:four helix bundle protein
MPYVYSFENLEAWRDARILVRWIYKITADFPKAEQFGLTKQMRRSSISVISNLAEGSARNTPKDKANFYQTAYSSIIELLNQIIVSNDLNFLQSGILSEGRSMIEKLTGKIAALRNSELNKLQTQNLNTQP